MGTTEDPAPIPLRVGERPPVPGAVKVEILDDGEGHHHTARTKARKAALDILYDADVTGRHPLDLLDEAGTGVRPLTRALVDGVARDVDEIDERIERALTGGWTLARMPALDRALARLAVWELSNPDTAAEAVIADAVALADEYSTDASAGFLSALLGSMALLTAPDSGTPSPSWLTAEAAAAPAPADMATFLLDTPDSVEQRT